MTPQRRKIAEEHFGRQLPLLSKMLRYPVQHIVEFGCGFGLACQWMATAGRQALGIDLAISGRALAEAKACGAYLREQSWDRIVKKFDAGYSWHVLEHCRDPLGVLHQWGAWIRPGGMLFLGVPAYNLRVTCSHIHAGWNVGQLAYLLALAGWDCRRGRFCTRNDSTCAIVYRPESMTMASHDRGWGDVVERLPRDWGLQADRKSLPGDRREYRWD